MSTPCVGSSQCISLVISGGVLTAVPVIDSSSDNALSCGTGGMFSQGALTVAAGTGFPTPLRNGMLVDYLADTNGTVWRFRYNAASTSAYPWEFVGGSPMIAQDASGGTLTAGNSVSGPSLSLPFVGDYLVEVNSGVFTTAGEMLVANSWARIGSESEPPADGSYAQAGANVSSVSGTDWASMLPSRTRRNNSTPGQSIQHRLQNTDASVSLGYKIRTLMVTPIRCA